MSNPYGPWATAIDAGRNPQLSAFWRRRLTMLVPASQTSPVLSRRNVLLLITAAFLTCVLPTFYAGIVVAEKPTKETSGRSGTDDGTTKPGGGSLVFDNDGDGKGISTSGGPLLREPSMGPSHPNDLEFPFYQPLLNDRTRKELHLSGEQEQKLHELSRKYVTEFRPSERKLVRELEKTTTNSPPEEKHRKMAEMWTKIRQEARPVRQQVEALLTPEQLAKLRILVLIDQISPEVLLYDFKARLTEEQRKEFARLARLHQQFSIEAYEKAVQANRENDEKAIAILTPAQREQLDRQISEGESGMPIVFGQQLHFQFTSPPGVGHVGYPPLWEYRKELGLSAEQTNKLEAILVNCQPSQELYKLYKQPPDIPSQPGSIKVKGGVSNGTGTTGSAGTLVLEGNTAYSGGSANGNTPRLSPELEKRVKQPAFRQKADDLKKQLHQQIDAVLTPQQLATLKKLALQKAVARRARDPEIPADLHPSEQQKTEMYRLFAAKAETEDRIYHESRERFVDELSPQQRQKCFDVLERQEWARW